MAGEAASIGERPRLGLASPMWKDSRVRHSSFHRREKRGPTQRIPLLCVSHISGAFGRAVTRCPVCPPVQCASLHPSSQAPAQSPQPKPRSPRFPRQRAAREAAGPPRAPRARPKFVNSRGEGRDREEGRQPGEPRTAGRRGEPQGGAMHSPEAARTPQAQSSAPHSAASTRACCMLRASACSGGRATSGTRRVRRPE